MPDQEPKAPVTIALFLNAKTPVTKGQPMFVTVGNSAGLTQTFWGKTPTMQIKVPYHDGLGDDYRVVVNVNGYKNGGGFFQADPKVHPTLSVLMMPNNAKPAFPTWAELQASHPATAGLIAGNVTDAVAKANYTTLATSTPLALASLMNLSAAMLQIGLGAQQTPLDFIKQVIWDKTLAQDRFFAYVDPDITKLLDGAVAEGQFEQESAADLHLHPGSTTSYKQKEYTSHAIKGPPTNAGQAHGEVFRFVKGPPLVSSDFQSHFERGIDFETGKECQARGLSVYRTEADVILARSMAPYLRKKKVARAYLVGEWGVITPTESKYPNHHTWWVPMGKSPEVMFGIVTVP